MCFAGTDEPTAYGEVISIGGLGPDPNKKLSAAISEIMQTKVSVPPNRFYIKFYDVKVRDLFLLQIFYRVVMKQFRFDTCTPLRMEYCQQDFLLEGCIGIGMGGQVLSDM